MIRVAVTTNGQPVEKWLEQWKFQPTVYLATASTIANVALSYALGECVAIAWWIKAMQPNTRLRDLHDIWSFKNSFRDILCAGTRFNHVAMAALVVALVPVNGPLLQRASSVQQETVVEKRNITIPIAQVFPAGFTGVNTGHVQEAGELTPVFSDIVRDYSDRRSINVTGSGCKSICKGQMLGAGYQIHCESEAVPYYPASWNDRMYLFTTNFTYHEDDHGLIGYTSRFESVCNSTWNKNKRDFRIAQDKCVLTPATLEYPIRLTNDTIELDPAGSFQTDRVMSTHLVKYMRQRGRSTHGGMWLALKARFDSCYSMRNIGAVGYQTESEGSVALEYQDVRQSGDCDHTLNDVTVTTLTATRELAFRTALAAAALNFTFSNDA
ncbi:hypothetical protein K491DRAFT_120292 [Lophiostoma macrostomum CBS 122681]|uniref:Uncharacterized protein n=1 Tax=Lophiostoma macrostomum CBS 122681 TaxID=1314788 RepID=A0A6A6TKA3_9PLEO|nr:hypothetical protein K491DRAFT_120292 [Lophiostoma macrostomum CBS 122681]